jgi:dUTPase
MIKFKKLNENAIVPTKGRKGDAGYDLFTLNEAVLQPH